MRPVNKPLFEFLFQPALVILREEEDLALQLEKPEINEFEGLD